MSTGPHVRGHIISQVAERVTCLIIYSLQPTGLLAQTLFSFLGGGVGSLYLFVCI